MANDQEFDYLFKIILLGDSGVGKTNILTRFSNNTFSDSTKTTLGVDFKTRTIEIDNVKIRSQVWDTSGQERFRSIAPAYYRGAVGSLIVYDTTSRTSFDNLSKWETEIKNHSGSEFISLLVGNKSDLVDLRAVSTDEGLDYAKSKNWAFIETSALQSTNIEKAFEMILKCKYLN